MYTIARWTAALVTTIVPFTTVAAPPTGTVESGPCAQASTEAGETPGEPTERDLCLALAAKYQGVDRNLEQMKASGCDNMNRNRNDTMAAVMCLGANMAGAGGGPQISLAGFRKIACVSAAPSGKPGYICDVATRLKSNNAMTRSMFDAVGGSVSTHRFVKTGGRWLVMPSKD